MSPATVYRCKAVKPNGERVDGCGWQGGEPARALVVDRCPSCGSPHLAIVEPHAHLRAVARHGFAIDLQIAPGITIRADGSADGPGLEAALQTAADVEALDTFRATPGTSLSIAYRAHNASGERAASGGYFTCIRLERTGVVINAWADTDEPLVSERQARRAAADAIRNGRI